MDLSSGSSDELYSEEGEEELYDSESDDSNDEIPQLVNINSQIEN